ncbi:MAG: glycosyltransferase family 2 protein [Puniceicoccales bacterium]|jgi:glycosyltransferase involved in cell wall biosynthesis|nr:glycosyltransferase family 2 protein [Puniceicoccales bacterium]
MRKLLGLLSLVLPSALGAAPPKVSICVPVYNVESYVAAALGSALNQTLSDIEIVCVDDGSTDGSLAILREYAAKDSRIKILENGKNRGLLYTRMRSILESSGVYVLCLDSDDELFPDAARLAYEKAEETGADAVLTLMLEADGNGALGNIQPWKLGWDATDRPRDGRELLLRIANARGFVWTIWDKLWRGENIRAVAEQLMPFAEKHHVYLLEDFLGYWYAVKNTKSYVVLPYVSHRYYIDRGIAKKNKNTAEMSKKFNADAALVVGKILADDRELVEVLGVENILRHHTTSVFRCAVSLPREEGWASFGNYLAAFPPDMAGDVERAMERYDPRWYGSWRAAKILGE